MKKISAAFSLRSGIPKAVRVGMRARMEEWSSATRREFREADAFIVSFPKAGRTWLRVMLGKVIAHHFGVGGELPIDLQQLAIENAAVPKIVVTHDCNPHYRYAFEIPKYRREYRERNVIFLVRDPRDMLISLYFERSKREHSYRGTLQEFLWERWGSLDSLIAFHNAWARSRALPRKFTLVRYEQMHSDTRGTLRLVLGALGLPDVGRESMDAALEVGTFARMRELEAQDAFGTEILRPRDPLDGDTYKTRRGKVGGYVDYLRPEEIHQLDNALKARLDPYFGY